MKRLLCPLFLALSLVAAAFCATAAAHATLVIGTLTVAPDPPAGAEALIATIELEDPGLVEVEDAVIFLELRPAAGDVSENEQPAGGSGATVSVPITSVACAAAVAQKAAATSDR
ncbi:MAG TPA: hypothetical protein VFD39_13330, partial [Trueperaceae bacterium]|nr:hypothetical protein [Trueperaceae bacterium]